MTSVEQAVTRRRVLCATATGTRAPASRREVEPQLLATSRHWFLVAWCRERDATRWFRETRNVELTAETAATGAHRLGITGRRSSQRGAAIPAAGRPRPRPAAAPAQGHGSTAQKTRTTIAPAKIRLSQYATAAAAPARSRPELEAAVAGHRHRPRPPPRRPRTATTPGRRPADQRLRTDFTPRVTTPAVRPERRRQRAVRRVRDGRHPDRRRTCSAGRGEVRPPDRVEVVHGGPRWRGGRLRTSRRPLDRGPGAQDGMAVTGQGDLDRLSARTPPWPADPALTKPLGVGPPPDEGAGEPRSRRRSAIRLNADAGGPPSGPVRAGHNRLRPARFR